MTLEGKARRAARSGERATDTSQAGEPASAGPEPDDAEGHQFLPDRSGEYLAKAREQDIRQHLSRRSLEKEAKQRREHK